MVQVEAVVLAAGASRRFGESNKLLQPFADSTVVGMVVATLLSAGLSVHVVTGFEADLVSAACQGATPVHNPSWEEGIGSSLAVGAAACDEGSAILVALGDMPEVRIEVVMGLCSALDGASLRIVVPVYAQDEHRFGHPVLFGAGFRPCLMHLNGDQGAKGIIEATEDVVRLSFDGHLADIDTPADFA